MSDEQRTIPLTAAQRSNIRITAILMLPVGLAMLATGVKTILDLLPAMELVLLMPLIFGVKWLGALIELGLGLCLFAAAAALLAAARTGTVNALMRGLRGLGVVYMVKATLLLLFVAAALFAFVAPMVM